jgi:hypothetical protein
MLLEEKAFRLYDRRHECHAGKDQSRVTEHHRFYLKEKSKSNGERELSMNVDDTVSPQ